jgi:trk system potassium uptake protein TrkH
MDDPKNTGSSEAHPRKSESSVNPHKFIQAEVHKIENVFEKGLRKYSAAEITIFGFACAILLGSLILYLVENLSENPLGYVDALFISTSAICVTGLTSIDFSKFTFAGQFVTMLLIQIGGFGVVTAFRLLWIGRSNDLSPGSALTLGSVMDVDGGHQTVLQVLASTAKITLAIEGMGCIFMYYHMQDRVESPLWFSVFHTISAFNNAGFGLNADNLMQYRSDILLNLIIAGLIIFGGIGYPVLLGIEQFFLLALHKLLGFSEALMEMVAIRKPERLGLVEPFYNFVDKLYLRAKKIKEELAGVASPLQMKIVFYGTIFLIFAGMVFTLIFEWHDERSLGTLSLGDKLLTSFFHSVTTRTAGFNTIDIGALQIRTLLLFILLMFIGAAPQGTAGGIKIPTFVTMLGYIRSSFRGRTRVAVFNYVVSKTSVGNAVKLYVLSSTFVLGVILMMSIIEVQFSLVQMAFETVSAFGTVGLSTGITMLLSPSSKLLLVATMFTGRVGLLTIGSAIIKPADEIAQAPPGTWTDDGMKLQIG